VLQYQEAQGPMASMLWLDGMMMMMIKRLRLCALDRAPHAANQLRQVSITTDT
jgi:hypothetical protein